MRCAALILAVGLVVGPASPVNARVSSRAGCGPVITAPLPDQPWPLRRLRPDLVWPVTQGAGITEILPLRVLDSSERSFDEALPTRIARAIRLATDSGADVINLSLTTVPVPELESAVRYALAHDVVIVAAAGNDGQSQQPTKPGPPEYPAAYDGVVAVAGVDADGNHVQTSSTGTYVDVAAPGLDIAGPAPQGEGYASEPAGGTSFAAAYVSGVVALVRAYWPKLTGPEVVARIVRTADRPAGGWDPQVGAGVVNPYWAVMASPVEAEVQAPPGHVTLKAATVAPVDRTKLLAGWVALIAVTASTLLFIGVWVVRHGRSRRWRPGRP